MADPAPTPGQVELARASYDRCRQSEAFLTDFYKVFLASNPSFPRMFALTDFTRQQRLLQHALGLLLSFASRPNPHLLERLGERHGPKDLNIPPEQYPLFVNALLEAVRRHDPQYTDDLGEAWKVSVMPGIRYMEQFGR
jgi:hemoglobin-like flavoprotein